MSANLWPEMFGAFTRGVPCPAIQYLATPLQAQAEENTLVLLAPNRFVVDWVKKTFLFPH